MNKLFQTEINDYIKQNKGAETAELQKRFGISYKDAKSIIAELLSKGDLVFVGGVKYSYVGKPEDTKKMLSPNIEYRRVKPIRSIDGESKQSDDEDDDSALYFSRPLKNEETDENELRRQALELIIETRTASVSLFQRKLPVGYIKACELIDWMESEGYITEPDGPRARKVLITREEFEKKFLSADGELESDDDDYADEPDIDFDELEKLLHDDNEESDDEPDDFEADFKAQAKRLADTVKRIEDKKNAPISADVMPAHSFWADESEFIEVLMERLERLIKSDLKMGQQKALKKAETYLEAVRDTHDLRMIQVYERLVYELKNISPNLYRQLKKQFCEE